MRLVPPARLALTVLALALFSLAARAQSSGSQPPSAPSFPLAPPAGPQIYPTPLTDSDDGFVSIFNGTSLDGWNGDPRY